MKVLDGILSTQLLAIFICLGALGMAVRIIASFSEEASRLRPKLTDINNKLKILREQSAERKPGIEKLQKLVEPVRAKEEILRSYFEQLTQIELQQMRREEAEREEKEGKGIRRRGSTS